LIDRMAEMTADIQVPVATKMIMTIAATVYGSCLISVQASVTTFHRDRLVAEAAHRQGLDRGQVREDERIRDGRRGDRRRADRRG
jgi:hypothetical protein